MPRKLIHLAKAASTLKKALAVSVADETELVWFQRHHRCVTVGDRPPGDTSSNQGGHEEDCGDFPRLTVLIRVVDGGRVGWHRTDSPHPPDLQNGLRQALAVAKVQPQVKRIPLFPQSATGPEEELALFDPAVAKLGHPKAAELLAQGLNDDESARLHWSETRLAVINSHGLERTAVTTEITLSVRCGQGPGAGFAEGSARRLEDLKPERILSRARRYRTTEPTVRPSTDPVPVVLSPEAMVELLNVLNTFAFSGRAFLDGSSFLSRHRDVQVFDRTVHVRDNALRIPGMPFPFDLEGSTKTPVDLIAKGQPSTPALSNAQGSEAGLRPTAQSVGGRDAMFGNLFLLPGAASTEDLIESAGNGLWIGHLDPPECHDPIRLEIRARARGVRRIVDGKPAEPLPDLIWQVGLLAALGRLLGIGNHSVVRAMATTPLGGICAPAVGLAGIDGFTVAED